MVLIFILSGCITIVKDKAQQDEQEIVDQSSSKPVITQFSANPSNISLGQSTRLNWAVTNAETVIIEPGIGNVAVSGSTAVSPSTAIKYTITATNPAGSSSATTEVIVSTSAPSSPEPSGQSPAPPSLQVDNKPWIEFFTANPDSILPAGSSTLSWNVANASSIQISSGVGIVASSGTKSVSPTTTTSYTLTATNSNGPSTQTVTVTVSTVPMFHVPQNIPMVILKPDLTVPFVYRHQLTSYTAVVENNGAVDSPACKIAIRTNYALAKFYDCPSIPAGGEVNIPFTMIQDGRCGDIGYTKFTITVEVDSGNNVEETDEGNNKYQRIFTCS